MNEKIHLPGLFHGRKWIAVSFFLVLLLVPCSIFVISKGYNEAWLIAPVLIALLAAFISLENFLLVTVFLVPLSVQLRFIVPGVPADLFLPTEPMLAIVMVIMIIKSFAMGETDRDILKHPVSKVAGLLLLWIFVTSLTGSMPLVSLKYLLTRIWFVAGFYLLALQLFRRKGMIRKYLSAWLAGMTPVAIYYLVRISQSGILSQESAYSAIRPFFNDHTVFGAALAFSIPSAVFIILEKGSTMLKRGVAFFQSILFSVAFVFSFSRAAWLSLAVAAVVVIIIRLRISWKLVLPVIVAAVILVAVSWPAIVIRLNENRQESSLTIAKQLRSISNIRNDVSNLERINRWKSALRMSYERPLFGWGPGTYQFVYAPYQSAAEKTKISTNMGEGGNAHSEYLGLLAETGIPGMVLYILLIFIVMKRGIDLCGRESENHVLLHCMVAGIVTYAVHGALNNFLDTDKISALFWGMSAVIVALDSAGKEKKIMDQ